MWKNIVVRQARDGNIIRRMLRVSCLNHMPKAADTHSEQVILIASPLQQRLHEAPQRYVVCTKSVTKSHTHTHTM